MHYVPLYSLLYIKNNRPREMMARIWTGNSHKDIEIAGGKTMSVGYLAEIISVGIWSPRGIGTYAPSMNVDLKFFDSLKKGDDGLIILENNDSSSTLFGRTTKILTDIFPRR